MIEEWVALYLNDQRVGVIKKAFADILLSEIITIPGTQVRIIM